MVNQSVKTKQEVESFLRQFYPKLEIFGIIFLDRDKNTEAIKMLGITPIARKEIVKSIAPNDYIETIIDNSSYGEMWVFGKDYNGEELYIKITLGKPNTNTICVSFHIAEYPLNYPFK